MRRNEGYCVIAVDMGKADFGGVLEGAIGFPPRLQRSHLYPQTAQIGLVCVFLSHFLGPKKKEKKKKKKNSWGLVSCLFLGIDTWFRGLDFLCTKSARQREREERLNFDQLEGERRGQIDTLLLLPNIGCYLFFLLRSFVCLFLFFIFYILVQF